MRNLVGYIRAYGYLVIPLDNLTQPETLDHGPPSGAQSSLQPPPLHVVVQVVAMPQSKVQPPPLHVKSQVAASPQRIVQLPPEQLAEHVALSEHVTPQFASEQEKSHCSTPAHVLSVPGDSVTS